MSKESEPADRFSYDLLADWSRHADAPLFGSEWTYHGTVTIGEITGALAWRRGCVGMAVGTLPVRNLDVLQRLQIGHDIQERSVVGWETVPLFWQNPELH